MKVAFICGCMEPGADGVGDYTRRLAAECVRQGHPSAIIALNDPFVATASSGFQRAGDLSLDVLRLPRNMPWGEKVIIARKWLEIMSPEWVSLQFVPFGFHPKGLLFGMSGHLMAIVGARPLHCMFHEIWVLWRFPLSLRKRLLGQYQRIGLRSFFKALRPKAFSTQIPLYQTELRKLGMEATLLPLHGNIPLLPEDEADQWLAGRCGIMSGGRCVKAGFFGSILATLNLSLVAARIAELKTNENEVLILLAGKMDQLSSRLWQSMEKEMGHLAQFVKLGELNERDASFYFSALDYGLTSYPPELMGKSGSVAAMNEHGVPVFSCGSMGGTPTNPSAISRFENMAAQPWTVGQTARSFVSQLQTVKA